jgi:hypothetical protein
MTTHQLTQISYVVKGQIFKNSRKIVDKEEEWKEIFFNDQLENGEYRKLIRSGIPLIQKSNNYQFIHESV